MMDCTFCIKFGDGNIGRREWFDEILIESERFIMVAGVGALADGYALVISRRHELSIASLPPEDLMELGGLISQLKPTIAKGFGLPIFFEHGASCRAGGGGACIMHAHLHILPTNLSLDDIPSQDASFEPIENFTDLARFKGQDYLFLQLQNGSSFVGSGQNRNSQWFRRIIAQRLGIPEEWDYAVYPRIENIKRTISGYKSFQV